MGSSVENIIILVIWGFLWTMGGVWILRSAFSLNEKDILIPGMGLGLIIETWFADLLARLLSVPIAFWIAAILVFLIGFCLVFRFHRDHIKELSSFKISISQIVVFAVLMYVFFSIAHGLDLYDDFKILPLVSIIASGKIPPQFPLDPSIVLNEYYFQYLIGAQIMRIGSLFPWTAMNLMRSFILSVFSITLGIWVYRLIKSKLAASLAVIFKLFASGVRWILLLLPASLIDQLDQHIQRTGSGLNSGTTLGTALISPWAAQGTGPFTYPFAFVNGFNPINILGLGRDNIGPLIIMIGLLTFNKWKSRLPAIFVMVVLIASLGLMDEILTLYLLFGLFVAFIIKSIQIKKITFTKDILTWLLILTAGILFSSLQGGTIASLLTQFFQKVTGGMTSPDVYHQFIFNFVFPPAIVDAHFGQLSFFNPWQLLVLLLEIGPILFIIPYVIRWGLKSAKRERWFEAGFIFTSLASFIMFFFWVTATRVDTAFNRAQDSFIFVSEIYAIPILFIIFKRISDHWKVLVGVLFFASIFSGFVIFGLEMVASQKPVLSTFINELDAKIMSKYWGKLDSKYMVFDPDPSRGVTLFGKYTNSSTDWYDSSNFWKKISGNPELSTILDAGYGYVYMDQSSVNGYGSPFIEELSSPCVKQLEYLNDYRWGSRYLYDIRSCK